MTMMSTADRMTLLAGPAPSGTNSSARALLPGAPTEPASNDNPVVAGAATVHDPKTSRRNRNFTSPDHHPPTHAA
jgi:hypothetical protein